MISLWVSIWFFVTSYIFPRHTYCDNPKFLSFKSIQSIKSLTYFCYVFTVLRIRLRVSKTSTIKDCVLGSVNLSSLSCIQTRNIIKGCSRPQTGFTAVNACSAVNLPPPIYLYFLHLSLISHSLGRDLQESSQVSSTQRLLFSWKS